MILDELTGFESAPFLYYSGHTKLLFEFEERYVFPAKYERFTLAPVAVAFFNAGNVFENSDAVTLNDLHYSAGFGLRFGSTKSVNNVVYHINVSWALNGPREQGLKIKEIKGIAKLSL